MLSLKDRATVLDAVILQFPRSAHGPVEDFEASLGVYVPGLADACDDCLDKLLARLRKAET